MENSLIRQINYKKNKFYCQIQHLLKTNKKIGMYGNGIYAGFLSDRLKRIGINIDYFVIDDTYYKYQNKNESVYPTSGLCDFKDSILIIGFETIVEKEEELKNKISKLYNTEPSIEIIDFEHCYIDWDFIDYKYILEHLNSLQSVYDCLKDDYSRKVMVEYLNACISGESAALCVLKTDHLHDYEYDLLFRNKPVGNILECGAFNGKTAVELSDYLRGIDCHNNIISLEPDDHNYAILAEKTKDLNNVKPLKYGVHEKDGKIFFDSNGGQGAKIIYPSKGNENKYESINTVCIDTLAEKYGNVGAILMDIEGSELAALKGGKKEILKNRPTLGVRIYHLKEDIFTIPIFIKEEFKTNNNDIYFRINANSRGILDMTLYAV